jgi:cytochrome oxidase Cu insertion factor (SCO1/SenC/PrrC family)
LPVLGEVPAFRLTERSGEPYGSEELQGRAWVADFIFTRCPDVCPAVTGNMKRLEAHASAPTLVSFSVDPNHDDPSVLTAYADRHRAGANWKFLTGERDAIAGLLKDGFHVAFGDGGPVEAPITHSDRMVLVDENLRIRGYYRGRDQADLTRLEADLARLGQERAATAPAS